MNKLFGLFVFSLLFIVDFSLLAQDETAIRPIINETDLRKIDKADGYRVDADQLIEEANRLNMEIFTVQADPDLDEKAITKKTSQLESQAQQKQVQASALYEKCNELKFGLYKQYLDAFWKSHEGEESDYINAKLLEEQASDNYFQAISYRLEARKMDEGFAKIEKLTEANNLENQAIQKQLTALGVYHGISDQVAQETPAVADIPAEVPPAISGEVPADLPQETVMEPPVAVPVTNIDNSNITPSPSQAGEVQSGEVVINQSMIDAYNRYVSSGQFTDTTLSTGQITGITAFDTDKVLQAWYDYIYGSHSLVSEQAVEAEPEIQEEVAEEVSSAVQAQQELSRETEIGIITDENKGTLVPSDDEVIYRVQLAANRTELSQRALSRMYYGNKNVEMINEDGWYKYSVGDFTTYEEASQFRKSSGISNAFVVAYRKGTRFLVGKSTPVITGQTQNTYAPAEQVLPSGLIFRIQVAASRVPLTTGQLQKIYKGNYPVEMISEDGWFKYQFIGVRLYSDALQIVRNVSTSGAFIVAYENGAKISLADAVRKNRELENTVKTRGRKGQIQEVEFHLQLAASKIAMHSEELKGLYAGLEPVSVIYEDGWYKYHLKAGNSAEAASQLKQACGISKAFIVAYRRAEKISYYDAIQQIK